jgi:hypothetical protein
MLLRAIAACKLFRTKKTLDDEVVYGEVCGAQHAIPAETDA